MPLLDVNNIDGEEYAQAYALRTRLSECAAVQSICGESGAADTLAHIATGPGAPAGYADAFSKDDLQLRNAWLMINPPEEGGATWYEDEAAEEGQLRNGFVFELKVRWQVAKALIDSDGTQGVFNYFWSKVSAIPDELRAAVRATGNRCPRMRRVERLDIYSNDRAEWTEQGYALLADFLVYTGDSDE